jgi:hypothetical protein
MLVEGAAMAVQRDAADEARERGGGDDALGAQHDQRPHRHQVGHGADRRVAQAPRQRGPDRRLLEREIHARGEGLRAEQRAVGVAQRDAGDQRDRRQQRERAREPPHGVDVRPQGERRA